MGAQARRLGAILVLLLAGACGRVLTPDAGVVADSSVADAAVEDAGAADAASPTHRVVAELAGAGRGAVTTDDGRIECGARCEATYAEGATVRFVAVAEIDSVFEGWGGGCAAAGAASACELVVDGPLSVSAAFATRPVPVSVSVTGAGTGRVTDDQATIDCPGRCQTTVAAGSTVVLTASAAAGSQFAGWSVPACGPQARCSVEVTEALSVEAAFDRRAERLVVARRGAGDGVITDDLGELDCGASCEARYPYGTVVSLEVTPDPWSRFVGWSGACAGASPRCLVTMDGAQTVEAEFEAIPLLAAGGAHNCALSTQGELRCWGYNASGQLGRGHADTIGDDEPASFGVATPIQGRIRQLCLGAFYSCVLTASGAVKCWGANSYGQLGRGHGRDVGTMPSDDVDVAVPVGVAVEAIACGADHVCARTANDTVRCWGRNLEGQLGRGNQQNIGDEPTDVIALDVDLGGAPVTAISAFGHHTCVVQLGGVVRCWGNNQYGQLGVGSTENLGDEAGEMPPPPLGLGASARDVAAGTHHTCVRTTMDTLRCWGDGFRGQLGYGDPWSRGDAARPLPVPDVSLGAAVAKADLGTNHTCAMTGSGALRCFGSSSHGQLGLGIVGFWGDAADEPVSRAVLVGSPVRVVAPGGSHTCVLLDSDDIRCWGRAMEGQLGYGDQTPRGDSGTTTPDQIGDVPAF